MNTNNSKLILTIGILAVIIVVGIILFSDNSSNQTASVNDIDPQKTITIYKSPQCGCCVGWASYLKEKGFEVITETVQDMGIVKDEHNIPHDMQSCHTAVIGDYFIEGHIPVEVINELLATKPEIGGIALPGMPSGSPGMPGLKRGPFTIYALTDGVSSEFMSY